MTRRLAALSSGLALLAASPARADDAAGTLIRGITGHETPEERSKSFRPAAPVLDPAENLAGPRLPRPFELPEITHPGFDAGADWSLGAASPDTSSHAASAIGLVRLHAEGNLLLPRRFYLGAAMPFVAAVVPDRSSEQRTLAGNIEGHARIAFPMPDGLSAGAEASLVAPTAGFDRNGPASLAAIAGSSLEPVSSVMLVPGAFAVRPSLDARIVRGHFVMQAREGLDIVIDTGGVHRAETAGRVALHFGVLAMPTLEASIEGTQIYYFSSQVPDERRSAMTVSPGIRWSVGDFDLGGGLLTNVGSPLDPQVSRFYAARFSVVAHVR